MNYLLYLNLKGLFMIQDYSFFIAGRLTIEGARFKVHVYLENMFCSSNCVDLH